MELHKPCAMAVMDPFESDRSQERACPLMESTNVVEDRARQLDRPRKAQHEPVACSAHPLDNGFP